MRVAIGCFGLLFVWGACTESSNAQRADSVPMTSSGSDGAPDAAHLDGAGQPWNVAGSVGGAGGGGGGGLAEAGALPSGSDVEPGSGGVRAGNGTVASGAGGGGSGPGVGTQASAGNARGGTGGNGLAGNGSASGAGGRGAGAGGRGAGAGGTPGSSKGGSGAAQGGTGGGLIGGSGGRGGSGGTNGTGGTGHGGSSIGVGGIGGNGKGGNDPGGSTAQGLFPTGLTGDGSAVVRVSGTERTIAIYVPTSAESKPPLLIVYHGTGSDPSSFIRDLNLRPLADANGFVIVGARAIANRTGGPCNVDHWENITYATGWNLCDEDPATNEDVVLTGRMIDEAVAAYRIDASRVYALGHSNGAFFSFFIAATLPNRIAAFAEGSGGAIRCENRGPYGQQWMGKSTTCAGLEAEPNYPSCTGPLEPARFAAGARVPPGYILHANNDNTVSVAWSCTLAKALGANNALVHIRASGAHGIFPEFATEAWQFLSSHSL